MHKMDLWSGFDTSQPRPPATTVQGRARRPTEYAVMSSLREWLLCDYAAAYARSLAMARIFRRIYWVDALGMESKALAALETREEDQPVPAPRRGRKKPPRPSMHPALASIASLADLLAQEEKPISLLACVLQEGSSKRKPSRAAQNEEQAEQLLATAKERGIMRASWLEVAPVVLKEVASSPAIFLLNPCGPTLFTAEDLLPIYQRNVPTELCLCIPHKQLLYHVQRARTHPEQSTQLTALLRSDRWKSAPQEEERQAEAIDLLLELFSAAMQRHFLLPVQRIALYWQSRAAMVESLSYSLLFATRRQDSLLCMNDAVCHYTRRMQEASYRGVLAEEWFEEQRKERFQQAMQRLTQEILQQGSARKIRRWPDLRQQVLLAHFGQFTVDEYDPLIRHLLDESQVRCQWRAGKTLQPEQVPGNDDVLLWR